MDSVTWNDQTEINWYAHVVTGNLGSNTTPNSIKSWQKGLEWMGFAMRNSVDVEIYGNAYEEGTCRTNPRLNFENFIWLPLCNCIKSALGVRGWMIMGKWRRLFNSSRRMAHWIAINVRCLSSDDGSLVADCGDGKSKSLLDEIFLIFPQARLCIERRRGRIEICIYRYSILAP